MKRLWMALLAMLLLPLIAPGIAAAEPSNYPPPPGGNDSSPRVLLTGSATAGSCASITASGFAPGETVTISTSIDAVTMNTLADDDGVVMACVPVAKRGTATITVLGESGTVASLQVEVLAEMAPEATSASGLPYTGLNRTALVLGVAGGLLALLMGSGLVWLATTSRKPSAPQV